MSEILDYNMHSDKDEQVEIQERVDDTLLGGLQVRIEGEFIDASLKFRLKQVQARLRHGLSKSGDFYED